MYLVQSLCTDSSAERHSTCPADRRHVAIPRRHIAGQHGEGDLGDSPGLQGPLPAIDLMVNDG